MDEEGVPLENPPYKLETLRCQGCVVLAEEQERISSSKEKGIMLFFHKVRGVFRR